MKLGTFRSRPQQNNNVKSLHSVYLRERERLRQIFMFPIGRQADLHNHSTYSDKNNFGTIRHTEYI